MQIWEDPTLTYCQSITEVGDERYVLMWQIGGEAGLHVKPLQGRTWCHRYNLLIGCFLLDCSNISPKNFKADGGRGGWWWWGWWLILCLILIRRSGSNTVKISLDQHFSCNVVCVRAWQFGLCSRTSAPLSSGKSRWRACSQIEKSLHTPTSSFYFTIGPFQNLGVEGHGIRPSSS